VINLLLYGFIHLELLWQHSDWTLGGRFDENLFGSIVMLLLPVSG
jgi:hypothetical protein